MIAIDMIAIEYLIVLISMYCSGLTRDQHEI